MRNAHKFWDRIAKKYARSPVADEASYQEKLRVTRDYFSPDMEVLEFGCGTGSTAIAHASYVKHIRAIDISEKMIEIAQGKAQAANVHNVTFERAAIDTVDIADTAVDAVLGLSVLHLLENLGDAIARVHRMLKPGGVFVSSTPCIGDHMKFFRFIAPIGHFLGVLPFVKVFTTKELEDQLIKAGFQIEHQWQPGKGKSVFIVARKAAT